MAFDAMAFDAIESEVVDAGITGAQAYTSCSLSPMINELKSSGLRRLGLSLFQAYPPVIGLELKIDVRAVSWEDAR